MEAIIAQVLLVILKTIKQRMFSAPIAFLTSVLCHPPTPSCLSVYNFSVYRLRSAGWKPTPPYLPLFHQQRRLIQLAWCLTGGKRQREWWRMPTTILNIEQQRTVRKWKIKYEKTGHMKKGGHVSTTYHSSLSHSLVWFTFSLCSSSYSLPLALSPLLSFSLCPSFQDVVRTHLLLLKRH